MLLSLPYFINEVEVSCIEGNEIFVNIGPNHLSVSFSHLYARIAIKRVSFPTGPSERHREAQHGRGFRPQPVWGPTAWLWRVCHRRRVWLHPAGHAESGPAMEKYLCYVHGKKAQVSWDVQTTGKEEGPKRKKKNYYFLSVAKSKNSLGFPNLSLSTFSWENKQL